MNAEPRVTINGRVLTEGQAMALRCAVASFHDYVRDTKQGLGRIAEAFDARLTEIEQAMGLR